MRISKQYWRMLSMMGQKKKMMRLAKYLAHAGVASRREAEEIIRAGKVTVNGERHTDLGKQIDETKDSIQYQNKTLTIKSHVYYIVNKPVGFICSRKRQGKARLVTELVPKNPPVYPVGRLDKESSGLVILTNDGDLAFRLSHPRHKVSKKYSIEVERPISDETITMLKRGVRLEEGIAKVDVIKKITAKKIEVTIHQGWNRQLRRMLGKLGYTVVSLQRTEEGALRLGALAVGKFTSFDPTVL